MLNWVCVKSGKRVTVESRNRLVGEWRNGRVARPKCPPYAEAAWASEGGAADMSFGRGMRNADAQIYGRTVNDSTIQRFNDRQIFRGANMQETDFPYFQRREWISVSISGRRNSIIGCMESSCGRSLKYSEPRR